MFYDVCLTGLHRTRGPVSPPTTEKRKFSLGAGSAARPATARSAKRRRGSARERASDLGQLGVLPVEILELVLLNLSVRDLGCVASTCSYFMQSGVVERVATALLPTAPRSWALTLAPRDSRLKAMHHCTFSERAERCAATVSLGAYHSACVIAQDNGQRNVVATFGRGFHGQLGDGGFESRFAPGFVDVTKRELDEFEQRALERDGEESMGVDTISLGGSHNVALTKRGDVVSWGLASSGECGHLGTTPIEVPAPRLVRGWMSGIKVSVVSAGASHTLAIGKDGDLYSCGRGRSGQLGHGHFQDAGPMRQLQALKDMRVVSAVAGGSHSICITSNGGVWAWGNCRYGQLGLGDLSFAAAAGWFQGVPWPCLVETFVDLPEPIVHMAAGGYHSMFVTGGGRMYVCGRGKHGALGIGRPRASPSKLVYNMLMPTRSAANRLLPELVNIHHFVRGGDGTVVANRVQQCSCGTQCRVALAAAGATHSVVLTSCGGVFTTGENSYGQLGHGHLKNSHTFTRVEALRGKNVVAVAAGHNHTGAIVEESSDKASKLYVWGRGDWGQLGTGEGRSYSAPRRIESFDVAPPLAEDEARMYKQTEYEEDNLPMDVCTCGKCEQGDSDDEAY